jgi:hemoglobin
MEYEMTFAQRITRSNLNDNPRAPTSMPPPATLYDLLGGVFGIAALVDHFSDALIINPIVGTESENGALREWSQNCRGHRMAGLKFQRTLWVCEVTGGPQKYIPTVKGQKRLDISEAHRRFKITEAEFDEVVQELYRSMIQCKVDPAAFDGVLSAFNAHKAEAISGQFDIRKLGAPC